MNWEEFFFFRAHPFWGSAYAVYCLRLCSSSNELLIILQAGHILLTLGFCNTMNRFLKKAFFFFSPRPLPKKAFLLPHRILLTCYFCSSSWSPTAWPPEPGWGDHLRAAIVPCVLSLLQQHLLYQCEMEIVVNFCLPCLLISGIWSPSCFCISRYRIHHIKKLV